MSRLRVDHIHAQPVDRLSGGERKRVALAAALIQKPDLLILDELHCIVHHKDCTQCLCHVSPRLTLYAGPSHMHTITSHSPNIHITTEPTNHLDVEAIEWLEDLLTDKQLTCLLVTHDRCSVAPAACAAAADQHLLVVSRYPCQHSISQHLTKCTRFLENVCQEILELDTGLLYRYPGSYEKFLEAKADRIRVEGLEQANAQNKLDVYADGSALM
eukprot:3020-Heterococcus_DN1.PRE.1